MSFPAYTASYLALPTTDLDLRLRGSRGLADDSDGAAIAQWDVQHTTANHAVQATAARKPNFRRGVYGGHGAVEFSSANFEYFNLTTQLVTPPPISAYAILWIDDDLVPK